MTGLVRSALNALGTLPLGPAWPAGPAVQELLRGPHWRAQWLPVGDLTAATDDVGASPLGAGPALAADADSWFEVAAPAPAMNTTGADVAARGVPERSAMGMGKRLIVGSSAIADLGLRTCVASMFAVAMIRPIAAEALRHRDVRIERRLARFYGELAAARDPALAFPAPTVAPRIRSRPANRIANWLANGHVHEIEFDSGFRPVNPAMRDSWRGFTRNNVVRAQHWRHDDGPRPTLCVMHGFVGSDYLFNSLFLALPWFYRCGYDVLLYTLPFHGPRAEKDSVFSGSGYFTHGLAGMAEAMAQAVHDFRSVLDYLQTTGVDKLALTGMSLGAYTAALVASVDDRLDAVIPNVPVVSMEEQVDRWFPANKVFNLGREVTGISRDESAAASAYHSPLTYRPLVPKDRRLIIAGIADRLAPPDQAEKLWRHWDQCQLHWFPGSHVLHVSQPSYLRRMTQFMSAFMFD
jgi:dienelactone hydrolase